MKFRAFASAAILAGALPLAAQLTLPPSGDNQKSTVIQHMGLVKVQIDYNSPNVTSPTGENRTGKIWGQLVPWGMSDLGFGTCGKECPWRGGSNENTVFTVSHDVKIEGQPLPAGSYGLHFLPGQDEWTVIFSKNSTDWGSYFYDAKEDALRVKVKPAKTEFHEFLTYEFTDRQQNAATVALMWENVQVPWKITADGDAIYMANIRNELRSRPGFDWETWVEAANYALRTKNLKEAEEWAQMAVDGRNGLANFTTLSTLARVQEAAGKTAESQATMQKALSHYSAGPIEIHQLGRQLQIAGKKEEAMKVFELNAKKFPNQWPVNVGLARGHAALGHQKEAVKYVKLALAQAPDELNRTSLQRLLKNYEEGKLQ